MQPLKPGHHAVGVVAYQIGVDSVRVEYRLRDVRFDFIGERPDNRRQLLQDTPSRYTLVTGQVPYGGTLSAPFCCLKAKLRTEK